MLLRSQGRWGLTREGQRAVGAAGSTVSSEGAVSPQGGEYPGDRIMIQRYTQAQPPPACWSGCQSVQNVWCHGVPSALTWAGAESTDSPTTHSVLSFGGCMSLGKYNLFFHYIIIFPLKRMTFIPIAVSFWPAILVLCLWSFNPEVFSVVCDL